MPNRRTDTAVGTDFEQRYRLPVLDGLKARIRSSTPAALSPFRSGDDALEVLGFEVADVQH